MPMKKKKKEKASSVDETLPGSPTTRWLLRAKYRWHVNTCRSLYHSFALQCWFFCAVYRAHFRHSGRRLRRSFVRLFETRCVWCIMMCMTRV